MLAKCPATLPPKTRDPAKGSGTKLLSSRQDLSYPARAERGQQELSIAIQVSQVDRDSEAGRIRTDFNPTMGRNRRYNSLQVHCRLHLTKINSPAENLRAKRATLARRTFVFTEGGVRTCWWRSKETVLMRASAHVVGRWKNVHYERRVS
jgi:hypothetical protein